MLIVNLFAAFILIHSFVVKLGRFYAFEKAHRLDQNSIGRGVRQFKTALLQRLEKVRHTIVPFCLACYSVRGVLLLWFYPFACYSVRGILLLWFYSFQLSLIHI